MNRNDATAAQEAITATFELIAAKAVTKALKASTGIVGAKKNFNKQVSKRGMDVPTWMLDKFVMEAWDRGEKQAAVAKATREPGIIPNPS